MERPFTSQRHRGMSHSAGFFQILCVDAALQHSLARRAGQDMHRAVVALVASKKTGRMRNAPC